MRIPPPSQSPQSLIKALERTKRAEQETKLAATQAALPFQYADTFQKALDKTKS